MSYISYLSLSFDWSVTDKSECGGEKRPLANGLVKRSRSADAFGDLTSKTEFLSPTLDQGEHGKFQHIWRRIGK
jgi:hypothetical protein